MSIMIVTVIFIYLIVYCFLWFMLGDAISSCALLSLILVSSAQ